MKKLIDIPDDHIFYRGTIIVIKDLHVSPKGNFDCKYALIGNLGAKFQMLDLYRSIGGVILHELEPNVPGHFGCNKQALFDWVKEHLNLFYIEGFHETFDYENRVFVEDLDDYFVQANRDLFI